MTTKVEVEFPAAFEHNSPMPIHLARFYVGRRHILRLAFFPDGTSKLLIPQSAIDDGSVKVAGEPTEGEIFRG